MDPIYQLGFKNERATLFFFHRIFFVWQETRFRSIMIGLYKGQECIHFVTRFFT